MKNIVQRNHGKLISHLVSHKPPNEAFSHDGRHLQFNVFDAGKVASGGIN